MIQYVYKVIVLKYNWKILKDYYLMMKCRDKWEVFKYNQKYEMKM